MADDKRDELERTQTSLPADAPTMAAPQGSATPTVTRSDGGLTGAAGVLSGDASGPPARFLPGQVVAERYRIIGLLGAGGMGEVYRADDLTLSQPVALKFLPGELERDPALLERFMGEVRIARQVSHANVCRVYDVGQWEGTTFLSMEFVDGEDLSSLLRRIGRLPEDKAVEIARQLCAGLAAAHAKGIVHRDLKPANVMLDREGRVRITDFGLAALADSISGAEARAGTPEYMAPEQLEGRDVTVQSDLYALGLVLYELFTGRRTHEAKTMADLREARRSSVPTSPRSIVSSIDPAVERVIEHCLQADPERRPRSALAVAGSLPGGDPLAAALAAGETPSPEMVAGAGQTGTMAPAKVVGAWVVLAAGALLLLLTARYTSLVERVGPAKSAARLALEARSLLDRLGYPEEPADTLHTFITDGEYILKAAAETSHDEAWSDLSSKRPGVVQFGYRESPQPLVSMGVGGANLANPPPRVSGMRRINLDLEGRLLFLEAIPLRWDEDPEPVDRTTDWNQLLEAAGFDPALLEETTPALRPLLTTDEQRAWLGPYPEEPDLQMRIEAAGFRGLPVVFDVRPPWNAPPTVGIQRAVPTAVRAFIFGLVGMLLLILVAAGLVARFNLKRGRGDRSGAARVGVVSFALGLASWFLLGHHTATLSEVSYLLMGGLSRSMLFGGMTWLVYIAVEPTVRRLWPELLITWTRLVTGRWRDPRVGRDVLIGCVTAVAMLTATILIQTAPEWLGRGTTVPMPSNMKALNSMAGTVGTSLVFAMIGFAMPLGLLFLLSLIRRLVRRAWPAIVIFTGLLSLLGILPALSRPDPVMILLALVLTVSYWLMLLLVLTRVGFLAAAVAFFFSQFAQLFPLTLDTGAFYFKQGLFFPLLLLVVGGLGGYFALGGQAVLGRFAEE